MNKLQSMFRTISDWITAKDQEDPENQRATIRKGFTPVTGNDVKEGQLAKEREKQAEAPKAAVQEPPVQEVRNPQHAPQPMSQPVAPAPSYYETNVCSSYMQAPVQAPRQEQTFVEYVVMLKARRECVMAIDYMRENASVFVNMEFIASEEERQRCVDVLSGAAYTLGCKMNKVSARGIYLISARGVKVIMDNSLQNMDAQYENSPQSQPQGMDSFRRVQPSQFYAKNRPDYTRGYAGANEPHPYQKERQPAEAQGEYTSSPWSHRATPTERFQSAAYQRPLNQNADGYTGQWPQVQ